MSREATRWNGEGVVVHSDVWVRDLAEELAVVPKQVQLSPHERSRTPPCPWSSVRQPLSTSGTRVGFQDRPTVSLSNHVKGRYIPLSRLAGSTAQCMCYFVYVWGGGGAIDSGAVVIVCVEMQGNGVM